MKRQTVGTEKTQSGWHEKHPAAATALALASLLVLVGCAPQTTSGASEPKAEAEPVAEATVEANVKDAYACGELAALSATVLRLGVDATGTEVQAVVNAAAEGLGAMTMTGTGSIEDAFKSAQQQAKSGMSANDFITIVEDAVVACDAAGLTIEYSMPGG